jgi:hypothetical protein
MGRYGGSNCGKCGGNHRGVCPAYYDEGEHLDDQTPAKTIHPEDAPTCEECGGQIEHSTLLFTFPPENGLCECPGVVEWDEKDQCEHESTYELKATGYLMCIDCGKHFPDESSEP